MEQAAKAYKSQLHLYDGLAYKNVLELQNSKIKFLDLLKGEKFSFSRLQIGDIISQKSDILIDRGSRDLEFRLFFATLSLVSFLFTWVYTTFYSVNLQNFPILAIFIIIFSFSFIFLMIKINRNELPYCANRTYEIMPNKKLLEIVEILKPEIDSLSKNSYELYLWMEMQTPSLDYGEKLSNAFWRLAVSNLKELMKEVDAILENLKILEYGYFRINQAIEIGKNDVNEEVHLKNIQICEEYDFRAIVDNIRSINCKITILYDMFMKNFDTLNSKDKSHLENGYS